MPATNNNIKIRMVHINGAKVMKVYEARSAERHMILATPASWVNLSLTIEGQYTAGDYVS